MRIVSLIPSRGSKKNSGSGSSNLHQDGEEILVRLEKGKTAAAFRPTTTNSKKMHAVTIQGETPGQQTSKASKIMKLIVGDDDDDAEREAPVSSRSNNIDVFHPTTGPADIEAPTSSKTLPKSVLLANGKRAYPKEKWVKNTVPLPSSTPPMSSPTKATMPKKIHTQNRPCTTATDGVKHSSFDYESTVPDDYLKHCSQKNGGKYQVDKHSLVKPMILANYHQRTRAGGCDDDDRYRASTPLVRQNSSDDEIAMWRSEDEEDDDADNDNADNDGGDWDMNLMPVDIIMQREEDDDAATLNSMEMVHYDPKNVQVLTAEHRFDPQERSMSNPYGRRNNKQALNPVTLNKPTSFIQRLKTSHFSQKKKMTITPPQGRNPSGFKKRSKTRPVVPTKGRTMSSVSGSGSEEEDDDGDDDETHTSFPSLLDEDYDDEEEDDDIDGEDEDGNYDDLLNDNLSSCSSGSLSEGAQEEYRKERRANHRRQAWKSRWDRLTFIPRFSKNTKDHEENEEEYSSDEDEDDSIFYTETDTVEAELKGQTKGRPRKEQEPLPWEDSNTSSPKNKNRSFFGKKQRRTVEDLPFPRSDSFDTTLLHTSDRYRDIFDDLDVLKPGRVYLPPPESRRSLGSTTDLTAGSAKQHTQRWPQQQQQKQKGGLLKSFFQRR